MADASVVANAIAGFGDKGAAARAALRAASDAAAPDLVDVETVSVLRRAWRRGDLTVDQFREAVGDLGAIGLTRYPARPLLRRAFDLRDNVTPYDAMYVALAENLDCTLVTGDKRLASAPGPRCAIHLVQS